MKLAKYVLLLTTLGSICTFNTSNNRLDPPPAAAPRGTGNIPPAPAPRGTGNIPSAPAPRGTGNIPPAPAPRGTGNIPPAPAPRGTGNIPPAPALARGSGNAPPAPALLRGGGLPLVKGPGQSNPVIDLSLKNKYKLVHWEKIDSISDSIWEKLKPEDLPKVEDTFFELFENEKPKNVDKKDEIKNKNVESIQLPSFLNDSSKAIIYGILARKSPKVDPTLIEAFNNMDNLLLDSSILEGLVANYINLDEDKNYKNAVADYTKANPNIKEIDIKWRDEPDTFFLDLHRKIKNFHKKGKLWLLLQKFSSLKDPMKQSIELFESIFDEIKNNKKIQQLLAYVLKIGNHLNQYNNLKSNAKGIHLKVISTIGAILAKDRKSLLYHLIKLLKKSDPTFEGLAQTFPILFKTRGDFNDLETQYNDFMNVFKDIQEAITLLRNVSESNKSEGDSFLKKANETFNEYENNYNEIVKRFELVKTRFVLTLKYLGYNNYQKEPTDKKLLGNIREIIHYVDKEYGAFKIDSNKKTSKKQK